MSTSQNPSFESARPNLYLAKPRTDKGRHICRLLVANRGEIACRVVTTAQALGIACIVIYTEEDRDSLHATSGHEAVCLGHISQGQQNPYQDIDLLVQTALDVRADAVHPGYGYLSENADFARAIVAAGLIFVGPSPESISALGDKREAKRFLMMHVPEVPLIPGYNGSSQDQAVLAAEADRIGYPILIKAAGGGGGRGMRIVHRAEALYEELNRAQSEALRSFGSSDCLLEKYIENGKHIEIQIVGDASGDILSLYERECSIQRRHQKVIEEAPSPWLPDTARTKMVETARMIAKSMAYENAGTVEFMVDVRTGSFYFLEVNTRIQVEHPITEMTTRVDIVSLQLYVASGGLWVEDDTLKNGIKSTVGHAIECRLCAEDPAQDFLPDSGLILRWTPGTEFLEHSERQGVRFETALQTGAKISVFFDSMIAKIVVWAATRQEACSTMLSVLKHTVCIGVKTNQCFLQQCLLQPDFANGVYTTQFISQCGQALLNFAPSEAFFGHAMRTSIVPTLLLRHVAPKREYRSFSSVRTGFRNQTHDQSNRTTDIVSVQNIATTSIDSPELFFCINWLQRGSSAEIDMYNIHPFNTATSTLEVKKSHRDGEGNNASLIRHFHQIFANMPASQGSAPPPTCAARVIRSSYHQARENNTTGSYTPSRLEWAIADFVVENDNRRHSYYVATSPLSRTPSNEERPRRLYCHVPALGTNIMLEQYSKLSFAESRRKYFRDVDAADVLHSNPERTYKALMPCKVLRIMKENGETVKAGDVLLIVESMKMEMKVSAMADGLFQCTLGTGDAVEEESVLCQVLQEHEPDKREKVGED
ncbi:Carbamoyl-phosphate synthase L chain, domain-containing protein [Cladophialophora immunda]|nr:Carbamoyl-phosphate synthase L chain, domain-containing protein [Cladophialophora immunda]